MWGLTPWIRHHGLSSGRSANYSRYVIYFFWCPWFKLTTICDVMLMKDGPVSKLVRVFHLVVKSLILVFSINSSFSPPTNFDKSSIFKSLLYKFKFYSDILTILKLPKIKTSSKKMLSKITFQSKIFFKCWLLLQNLILLCPKTFFKYAHN